MPTTNEILQGLTMIANEAIVAAILWHAAIAIVLAAIARGWRPGRRLAIGMLAAPLVSVAALAFAYANPFNGAVFSVGALALLVLAARDDHAPVAAGPRWATALGLAMIAFAWAYPHFLRAPGWSAYLYAAPVGLVPCPSLALAIGFALLAGGLDRRVAGVLASFGLVYGLIGAFRFGVLLDLGLIAGGLGLLGVVVHPVRQAPRVQSAQA